MLKLFVLVCLSVNAFVDSLPLEDTVIEERIVGGNDTDITKVPYQVALFSDGEFFVCGGFIVSPSYVVTSGHCIYDPARPSLTVRAGSTSRLEGGVIVNVTKIFLNPKFNVKTEDYDVAVLELATPLKFSNKIQAVKLATKEPPVGTELLLSGWGFTREVLEPTNTLQSVNVPIYDRTKCTTIYKDRKINVTPRMICAGGDGRMPYYLDHGGPLVYKGEVVGLVSVFPKNAQKDIPAIFGNIVNPEMNKFIKDNAKL